MMTHPHVLCAGGMGGCCAKVFCCRRKKQRPSSQGPSRQRPSNQGSSPNYIVITGPRGVTRDGHTPQSNGCRNFAYRSLGVLEHRHLPSYRPTIPTTNQQARPTIPTINQQVRPAVPKTNQQVRPTIPTTNQQVRPTIPTVNQQVRPTISTTNQQVRPTIPTTNQQVRKISYALPDNEEYCDSLNRNKPLHHEPAQEISVVEPSLPLVFAMN